MKVKTGVKAGRWNGNEYANNQVDGPLRERSCKE